MRVHFFGGAKTVTGSNYLLEAGGLKILIDCGLFQGTRYNEEHNYLPFPFDPSEIDYLVVTHTHADHIGRIPKLYGDGFRGQIITSEPTAALLPIALEDTLEHISVEGKQLGHPPLFKKNDLTESIRLVRGVSYAKTIQFNSAVSVTLHEASHILGSSILEFMVKEEGAPEKRMLFSGDLGNPPAPLLNPIDYVKDADYAVIESAYGNRIHEDRAIRRDLLQKAIIETVERGGVLMIPSFAVERIQELLLEIDILMEGQKIPSVPVYLDSPLAIKMTDVYGTFSHYFNASAVEVLKDHGGLFKFPWLTFTLSVDDSKRINTVEPPKIIIAGSGMSQGGRIIHHESRYLSDPKNSILFVGYQVEGSLGRRILQGDPEVKILGNTVPVRCHVEAIGGYSAHADQEGLLKFIAKSNEGRGLKKVFVVQGEEDSAVTLAGKITSDLHVPSVVPGPSEAHEL